jgi:hypothetical protein
MLKMLGGALLAYLALSLRVPADRAVDPNQMYLAAYELVSFPNYGWAVAATALFVVVSQLKINVTNAYAGSLAWSNFFAGSRTATRGAWCGWCSTPDRADADGAGRLQALGGCWACTANIAISWMMAVVADLVINKPLGLSPRGIEFKRAHLYDINPVGVGAMGIGLGAVGAGLPRRLFGPMAQAFSAVIALVTAFVTAPLIAWATKGPLLPGAPARRAPLPGGANARRAA